MKIAHNCADSRPPSQITAPNEQSGQPGQSMSDSRNSDDQDDPGQRRADVVTKEVLRGLLDVMLATLDGVRANQDPEYLHDLRVATRRTRSVLTQIKRVFPDDRVDEFKAGFCWLQQVTSPMRDLDVYLHAFESYQASLPAPLRPHLEPLRSYLLAIHEGERARLAAILDSERFGHLIQGWRTFLDAPVPNPATTANGLRPIKEVADERIWHLVRQVRREGRAIRADSPPEDLHELRKRCKKLRYLMEFFRRLYPNDDIQRLIKLLKTLLDCLGRFQDLTVQVRHLGELAQRMRDDDQADTDTLLAMGALIGHLLEGQQALRGTFDDAFAVYLEEEHQNLFRALFAPNE
jgi:CHAD domain-containing protein